jgi:hypothetical protein
MKPTSNAGNAVDHRSVGMMGNLRKKKGFLRAAGSNTRRRDASGRLRK